MGETFEGVAILEGSSNPLVENMKMEYINDKELYRQILGIKELGDEVKDKPKAFEYRKELLKALWDCESEDGAVVYFKRWYFLTTPSRLKPVIEVARMLKRHIENILTYVKYRITNAFAQRDKQCDPAYQSNRQGV